MKIEQDSTVTQVTYGFRIEDAEPITKNLSKIRMRPTRATVVVINDRIGRIIVTGPALRLRDDFPLVGGAHSSVYGEQEVDADAPEVVRRVFEAARAQLGQAVTWHTLTEVAEQIGAPLVDVEALAGQINDTAALYDRYTGKVSGAGLEMIREHLA